MVEIETASRPARSVDQRWRLSSWPLRSKVAAVVALPLVLAMVFGALQVQRELAEAAELSSASEDMRIVDPLVRLDGIVGSESISGVSSDGTVFDDTVGAVRAAVDTTSGPGSARSADVENAIGIAVAFHERLAAGPVAPLARAEAAASVTGAISRVLSSTITVDNTGIETNLSELSTLLSGNRAAQTQQLLVSVMDPAVLGQANRAAGRELSDIDALSDALGADNASVVRLSELLDQRLTMYSSAATGAPTNPFLAAEQSAQIYSAMAIDLQESFEGLLSSATTESRSVALRDSALVLGSVLIALVLALIVARSLVTPIRRLRLGALSVARRDLPDEIEQIRTGGITPVITPVPVHTREEIGQLARAVDAIHEEALQLAGEQARLRVQIGSMFETLSRRSRSLVDQQLALIEELERDEDEPRRLDSLFRLDHLATRMRRNGANLMVLADTPTRRGQNDQPVALDAVMSAAISEVEDYRRVLMLDVPDAALTAAAAPDIVHLVAELIDNALRYSPPDSAVAVTAGRAIEGGILLEVADRGLGMPLPDIEETNQRLSTGGEVTPETARRMGLFVVGRLAARHGVTVRLRATQVQGSTSGVTVSVHIPVELVVTSFPSAEQMRPHRRVGVEAGAKPGPTSANGAQRDLGSAESESPKAAGASTSIGPKDGPITPHSPTWTESPAERTAPVTLISTNGHTAADTESTSSRLPRRRPGASGVDEHIALSAGRTDQTSPVTAVPDLPARKSNGAPSDTSSFFGARPAAQASKVSAQRSDAAATPPIIPPDPLAPPPQAMPIYQRMVSEWLVDPATGQGRSHSWSSSADAGWAAAEVATETPVRTRTESGLPVRRPGARLVPGAVDNTNGTPRRSDDVPSSGNHRSPEVVRDKLTTHFTGVRTGRAEDVNGRHRTETDE